ncbi:hypothetical protein RclHR1_00570022 [Rhizophagus clarus]|uniref:High mobility group box domain-containing protein n=1 Tax=Rhizophagus clarus TaxID=94130 RepID=A0A2Z6RNU0_9GLOM|nr:hypothetical protein RclHR1_00570022 [Rhizophagus clarus]GET04211.1 high mobility group box domain-containing protein [Rhizophagus clarus]
MAGQQRNNYTHTISFALDIVQISNNIFVPPSPPEPNNHITLKTDMTDEEFIKSFGYPFTIDKEELLNNSDETREAKRSRRKGTERTPRPPNAFMIYRRNKAAEIKYLLEGEKSAVISKIIGNMWKEERDEVKELFKTMARVAEKRHAKKHPNYSYKPQQNKEKRTRPQHNAGLDNKNFDINRFLPSPTTDMSSSPSISYSGSNTSTNTSTNCSPLVVTNDLFYDDDVDLCDQLNNMDFDDNTNDLQFVPPLIDINMVHNEQHNDEQFNEELYNNQNNEQYNELTYNNQFNGQVNDTYQYNKQHNEEVYEVNIEEYDEDEEYHEKKEQKKNNDQPNYYEGNSAGDWRWEFLEYLP